MLRIKADKLEHRDNKVYFRDVAFSGVAFFLDDSDERIVEKKIYEEGVYVREYHNEILEKYFDTTLEVNFEAFDILDEDMDKYSPPYAYEGKLFTGVFYEFKEDTYCTEEMCFVNGYTDREYTGCCGAAFEWDIYGELLDFELTLEENVLFQQLQKYPNGEIKEMIINFYSGEGTESFSMKKNEDGSLRTLSVSEKYFISLASFPIVADEIYFDYIKEKSYFETVKLSRILVLIDKGIDNEIFGYICENDTIENLEELHLMKTSIDTALIENIAPSLKTIDIDLEEGERLEIFKTFKEKFPTTKIILNREKL